MPDTLSCLSCRSYAGIGGLSEVLGWNDVQREENKQLLGGSSGVINFFIAILAIDVLVWLVQGIQEYQQTGAWRCAAGGHGVFESDRWRGRRRRLRRPADGQPTAFPGLDQWHARALCAYRLVCGHVFCVIVSSHVAGTATEGRHMVAARACSRALAQLPRRTTPDSTCTEMLKSQRQAGAQL
eukprot:360794-Chlamydomonas_euryale.AAC.18